LDDEDRDPAAAGIETKKGKDEDRDPAAAGIGTRIEELKTLENTPSFSLEDGVPNSIGFRYGIASAIMLQAWCH
jgi:hypothetical protein